VTGVLCSVYLSLAVMFVFFCNRKLVPHPIENIKKAELAIFDFNGVVSTFPLIIFAYMYQVNIPSIYYELERRNYKSMSKVVSYGSIGAVILYIMVGIFGYLTFVDRP